MATAAQLREIRRKAGIGEFAKGKRKGTRANGPRTGFSGPVDRTLRESELRGSRFTTQAPPFEEQEA